MSSSYSSLVKDIQIGKIEGEDPVSDFIRSEFGIDTIVAGHANKAWDLEVVGVYAPYVEEKRIRNKDRLIKKFESKFGHTFEIKRDMVSDRTGNFFFEVFSNIRVNNPGCIAASKADMLVIVTRKEFIFINRGLFLSWIISNLYYDNEFSRGWKMRTCKKVKEVELKSSLISPQVRGILIPLDDIKKEASVGVFKRGVIV